MATVEKVDVTRAHRAEYATPRTPVIIDIAPARYLAIDGAGEPGGAEFQERMGALFGVAYTAKFAHKRAGQDFKVGAVEGLWWPALEVQDWHSVRPEEWRWKVLVRVPDFVSEEDVTAAVAELHARKKPGPFEDVRLETIDEGPCVQVLHVGSYAEEEPTIAAMTAFAAEAGFELHGAHHEIYLSDPRRVAPERRRTILRHPVRPKRGDSSGPPLHGQPYRSKA